MNRPRPILLRYYTYFLLTSLSTAAAPPLLIVSFDGFRWDYFDKAPTPNFDRLRREGASATAGIHPSYMTKTLPNHFTLVTGWYEESHGVVANEFYDPTLNATFSSSNSTDSRMFSAFGADPVWVTAKRAGLRTGCYFWIGCEAEIKGLRPDVYERYNWSVPFPERVDKVVEWLTDSPPVQLALLYFNEPDHTGHEYGPDSPQIRSKIIELDDLLGDMMTKLEAAGLWGSMNIIITSDHGMSSVNCSDASKMVMMRKYVENLDEYKILSSSPVHQVWNLTEGGIKKLVNQLKDVDNIYLRLKEEMPREFHYKNNRRIAPLIIEAREGHHIIFDDVETECGKGVKGYHGFNNSYTDMSPIFLAAGPDLKPGAQTKRFSNVDIYPLMCKLLNISPSVNNGSLEPISHIFKSSHLPQRSRTILIVISVISIIVVVSLILLTACCLHLHLTRRRQYLSSLDKTASSAAADEHVTRYSLLSSQDS